MNCSLVLSLDPLQNNNASRERAIFHEVCPLVWKGMRMAEREYQASQTRSGPKTNPGIRGNTWMENEGGGGRSEGEEKGGCYF